MDTKHRLFDTGLAVSLTFSVFGCATPRDADNLEVDLSALLEEEARVESQEEPQTVETEFSIDTESTPELSDADSEAFLLGPDSGDNEAAIPGGDPEYVDEENPFDDNRKELEEQNLSAIFFDDKPIEKSPQDFLAENSMVAIAMNAPEIPDMPESISGHLDMELQGQTMMAEVSVPEPKVTKINIIAPKPQHTAESGGTQVASVPNSLGKSSPVTASTLWRLKQLDPSKVLYSGNNFAGTKKPRMVRVLIDGKPATILSA